MTKNNNNKSTKNRFKNKVARTVPLSGRGDYATTMRKMGNTKNDIVKALGPVLQPMIKKALISSGQTLGGMAGNYMLGNGAIGSKMGSAMGAKLSKLIGSGDYITNDGTSSNSLMKGSGDSYASFNSDNKGVRIRHREYLQDVISPNTGFNIESYPINPGLPFSFPYLANIALNFEEYKFLGLVYEFVSTATPYSTVSNMGSVIATCEYNTANNDYTSKTQMENSDFAISAAPYKNMVYGVECKKNWSNSLFIRTGASILNGPLTDLGTFFIATNSVQAGNIGELWVTYDIEFTRPRASSARFGLYHSVTTLSGTSVTPWSPGNGTTVVKVINGVFTSATLGTNVVTFPDAIIGDVYKFDIMIAGGGTFSSGPVLTPVGFTAFNCLFNNSQNSITSPTSSLNSYIGIFYFLVTAFNPTMTIGPATATSASYQAEVVVTDVGNGFTPSQV